MADVVGHPFVETGESTLRQIRQALRRAGGQEAASRARDQDARREPSDEEESPESAARYDAEMERVLDAHATWLRSDKEEGERANLKDADLQGVNLEGADLRRANLRKAGLKDANLAKANLEGANLYKADLREANLREACLRRATLRRADLEGADLKQVDGLREADLKDANLAKAKGLSGTEFAGADITGAQLPDDIARFEGLGNVVTNSTHARRVFLALIGGCVYSWLTIAMTTDAALLTNSASTPLPIIQTKVPIAGFYWAAPFILFALYVYLHLYLQSIWEALARLPAVFPDGGALDEKAYPWLLISLVRAHVPRLKRDRSALWWARVGLSLLGAWGLVPFTLFLFWLRYLPRHDAFGNALLIASLLAAAWTGVFFYRFAGRTLRGGGNARAGQVPWAEATAFCLVAFVTVSLSFATMTTNTPLDLFGYRPYANLEELDVSTKHPNWTENEKDETLVKGANLEGMDLRYVEGFLAFLVKADLEAANLYRANLKKADLRFANLKGAYLKEANLAEAVLKAANLKEAYLPGAILQKATLIDARLKDAVLEGADLEGANLQSAVLKNADLRNANLQGANLSRAKLDEAQFWGADLQGANLTGVDLGPAKGLTGEQIDVACSDGGHVLPDSLQHVELQSCSK